MADRRAPIINGRRMDHVPDMGVSGDEIIRSIRPPRGRRVVLERGLNIETVDRSKRYSKRQLLDKKGRGVKIRHIPDRTKGYSPTFTGARSSLSKRLISEQVFDIAQHLYKDGVEFDTDNADWLVIPRYRLPSIWSRIARTSPLLLIFPTEYPQLPPVGCYLPHYMPGSANGHLYPDAYHDADPRPLERGWNWYCTFVNPGSWHPARIRRLHDWKKGDSLWTYMALVQEALSGRGE